MRQERLLMTVSLAWLCTGLCPILGYEDLTHQQLSKRAVRVAATNAQGVPADMISLFVDANGNFKDLGLAVIRGAGEGPEGRGKPDEKPNDWDGEDYTTYTIDWGCPVHLVPVVDQKEPLHHFRTGLWSGGPAWDRFVQFYHDAIRLWKRNRKYEAAFTLGRAVHLIEDMEQPQHAWNEAHMPLTEWWAVAGWRYKVYNPSYLEFFTEAHLHDKNGLLTTPVQDLCEYKVLQGSYADYTQLIGGLTEFGCLGCSAPGNFFRSAVADSDNAREAILWREFTSARLEQSFNPDPAYPMFTPLASSTELPFQYVRMGCGTKEYRDSGHRFHPPDYMRNTSTTGTPKSFDLACRLEEGRVGAESFADWHTNALLKPAVADSAGVIVAFWNEVKDSCGTSSAKESSGTCLTCFPDKPSGESPDDSLSVKASSREESGAVPASHDWHDVCRVGIGKGLPTMGDYGLSSSLMEQLAYLDTSADPAVAEALYAKLEALEAKYSGPQNLMPGEAARAPGVAVWTRGSSGPARSLAEAIREPVRMLEEPQEPVFTDEEALSVLPPQRGLLDASTAEQKILVLPTGSLYGLRAGSMEAKALRGFVEQGGVIVSFTQPYGDDFSALPVPAGEELLAAGFKQDLSCFANSAYPCTDHPILSGITTLQMGYNGGACGMRPGITAGFDGFLREMPSNATMLLT